MESWKRTLREWETANRQYFELIDNTDAIERICYCAEIHLRLLDVIEADLDAVDVSRKTHAVLAAVFNIYYRLRAIDQQLDEVPTTIRGTNTRRLR
jgi:hypothetical protein